MVLTAAKIDAPTLLIATNATFDPRSRRIMADHRRAHPAYALEVDEMILEYLIYTTTKAHLHGAENAASLLQIFDHFLQLFKTNHSDSVSEFNLSIKLLEFAVLFTQRKDPQALSSSSRDQLKQSSKHSAAIRVQWWERGRPTNAFVAPENSIIHCWRNYFDLPPTILNNRNVTTSGSQVISLIELLPRFLDLSASMAVLLDQEVSQKWMKLAAEFMLQSAWEEHVYLDSEGGDEPLKVAFGWGRWGQRELEDAIMSAGATPEEKRAEVQVDAMFQAFDGSPEEAAVAWSKIRLEYLSAFGTTPPGVTDVHQGQRWQVKRLEEMSKRFPSLEFDDNIVAYIEDLWKLGRKPVLVQVEEGQIEGLGKKGFQELMEKVFPKEAGSQGLSEIE